MFLLSIIYRNAQRSTIAHYRSQRAAQRSRSGNKPLVSVLTKKSWQFQDIWLNVGVNISIVNIKLNNYFIMFALPTE